MSDVEKLVRVIKTDEGKAFIQFCLEQLKTNQSVQTIDRKSVV